MHRKLGRQNAVICNTFRGVFYRLGQNNKRLDKLGHCLDSVWTCSGESLWYVSGVCEGIFCKLGQVTPRLDKLGDCLDTAWTGCGQCFALRAALRFANFAPRTSLRELRSANFAPRASLRELRYANFAPRASASMFTRLEHGREPPRPQPCPIYLRAVFQSSPATPCPPNKL